MNEVFRTVSRLLKTWWQGDKIRVPISEGRLLGLTEGDFIYSASQRYEIESKQRTKTEHGVILDYHCRTASGSLALIRAGPVSIGQVYPIQIFEGTDCYPRLLDDISCYQAPKTRPDRRL